MRLTFLTLTLACAAFASTSAQTTTYVDGNVTGLSPNTGGTLTFDDQKAMVLRTGLTSVSVPYDAISHAELGAVKENSHDVPLYKFWARKHKTETQLLVVNFKDEQGADRTMTLELAQPAAQTVLNDLESRTGKQFVASEKPALIDRSTDKSTDKPSEKPAEKPKKADPMASAPASGKTGGDWWGDQYWKTPRNSDKWSKPSGSNNDQQ